KPRQSLASLWNISFGFFGIQIGFALQTANMSRIFQSLGSSLDDLPALWIAAPLTGLLVQPIVGHLSDRTWLGRLGRRRPYFIGGAILTALSLVLMPLSTQLLMAAILLWALGASADLPAGGQTVRALASRSAGSSLAWIAAGVLVVMGVLEFALEKEMYVLGGLLIAYGLASIVGIQLAKAGRQNNMLANIVGDFSGMPTVMKRLALAQFFSWSALFIM